MLITHEREKLINAILYFAYNTKYLGKIKLFKLLYILDFDHFCQTGRSVTGLDYNAWKFGPVPIKLMQEWDDLEEDLNAAINIEFEPVIDYVRQTVKPKANFDDSHFTKRELRIMQELAERYCETPSPKMIDVTHVENGAWAKIWNKGTGFNQQIPYMLAISDTDPHRDAIMNAVADYAAIHRAQIRVG